MIVAFPHGANTIIAHNGENSLKVLADNREVQEYFGAADIASYASGGQQLIESPANFREKYYLSLWSPGMFLLHGGMLLMGDNTPVVLMLMLFSILLWCSVFSKLCNLLVYEFNSNVLIAFLVPIMCFILPPFRNITLTSGVLGAESYSIAAFILGFLFYVQSIFSNNSRKLIIYSGIFFALAAYMKASFDIYMRIFAILVLFVFLVKYLYDILRKKEQPEFSADEILIPSMKKYLLMLGVFFLATLPWRIYHIPGWINADYMYAYIWMADDQLADFVVAGGANAAACKIKPDVCKSFHDDDIENSRNNRLWLDNLIHETKIIIITNPFSWAYYKLPYLYKYWFNEGLHKAKINTFVINSVILAFILGVLLITLFVRSAVDIFCCLIILTVIGGTIIPHFVMHFEARYLFPLKIIAYFILIISLANLINQRNINK